jgi:putative phosphoesterase
MRLGIISDIHSNFEALKVVLEKLDELKVSKIYCLGDVVGYYSQVNEVCDELRKRDVISVMGNHDWYLSSNTLCKRSEAVNEYISYQRSIISRENLEWIRSFPIQTFAGPIHMVHGGWENPIDEYLREPNAAYFENINGDVFMSGHTHVQFMEQYGTKTYCNPGSVGQPRDGDPRAAFAVFDHGQIQLHRVEFDMNEVYKLMVGAGFSNFYYK